MIDRQIGKIKIRRGSDLQRKNIVFPEGEILYTIDSKRIYVGDGVTSGGIFISNRNFFVDNITIDNSRYIYGDILHNLTDSTTYIVGSADNGSLSAIFIGDAKCCKNLRERIAALKLKLTELIKKANELRPKVVDKPPITLQFVTQPVNISADYNKTAIFTASAVGSDVVKYQWYKEDGTIIPAAIKNEFKIDPVNYSDGGSYYCIAICKNDSLKSDVAKLTVNSVVQEGNFILYTPELEFIISDKNEYIEWTEVKGIPPKILTQPISQTIDKGSPVTFTVTADGSPVLTYQWYKDNQPIDGATQSTYIDSNPLQNATYKCLVKNDYGSVYSDTVTTTVNNRIDIVVKDLTLNFDLCSELTKLKVDLKLPSLITVTVDNKIYSKDTSIPAFKICKLSTGSKLTLINNSYIIGAGGSGGLGVRSDKPLDAASQIGKDGGTAIYNENDQKIITIINNDKSIIAGGGGGGGGAGVNKANVADRGGNGGIGGDAINLNGTSGTTNNKVKGGDGGGIGLNGSDGGNGTKYNGGKGGYAGYAIIGRDYITFEKAGDIRGLQK